MTVTRMSSNDLLNFESNTITITGLSALTPDTYRYTITGYSSTNYSNDSVWTCTGEIIILADPTPGPAGPAGSQGPKGPQGETGENGNVCPEQLDIKVDYVGDGKNKKKQVTVCVPFQP